MTGASSGLGVETTRVLSLAGANVLLAVRNRASGEAVAKELRAKLPPTAGALSVGELDLADLASLRPFVERHGLAPLDLLINNAGVMATPLGVTAQGFETQLGTNHLGHFALSVALLPALRASAAARVVTVSSSLHRSGKAARMFETLEHDPRYERRKYAPFDAYGDAKLANVLFAKALSRRLPPTVLSFSLHPGVIPTRLTRSMGALGAVFRSVGAVFMKSVEQGAATSIYAATAPELANESGAYLQDSGLAKASAEANDRELGERLWSVSDALVRDWLPASA